jgi:hypothetical protein
MFFKPILLLSTSCASTDTCRKSVARIPNRHDANPHWFLSLRGLIPLLACNWDVLSTGPFSPLLLKPQVIHDTSGCPDDVHLVKLEALLVSSTSHGSKSFSERRAGNDQHDAEDPERMLHGFYGPYGTQTHETDLDACRQALEKLKRLFYIPFSPYSELLDERAGVHIWPGIVSQRYLDLLYDRVPEALVLLAYYCVLLKRADSHWHYRGVGVAMLEAVEEELSGEWLEWIQWAKDQPVA